MVFSQENVSGPKYYILFSNSANNTTYCLGIVVFHLRNLITPISNNIGRLVSKGKRLLEQITNPFIWALKRGQFYFFPLYFVVKGFAANVHPQRKCDVIEN